MKSLTAILFLIAFTAFAEAQQPIASHISWTYTTNNDEEVTHWHDDISGSNWVAYTFLSIGVPHTYKDTESGIIFLVEADGRHITAISPDGRILWRKDPHANLENYRTDNPSIVKIGWHGDKWPLFIVFNSSQAGWIDEKTGDFHETGRL
jgi:hypothetical protein